MQLNGTYGLSWVFFPVCRWIEVEKCTSHFIGSSPHHLLHIRGWRFLMNKEAEFAGTSLMIILPFWWTVLLLTMLTMATPKLHRIPKEMQKPSPLSIAMMYLRGSPKHVQSHRGVFRSWSSLGLPSSVSSIASPVCCRFSILLHDKPII